MQKTWPEIAEPPALAADEVHVWSVSLDGARSPWSRLMSVLTDDERERAERFRLERVRRQFVTARAALRTLLGRYLDRSPAEIVLEYAANGKPCLQPTATSLDLQFNVAHSDEMALVAIARGCEVGVDIERLRHIPHWREIAERYFHPREFSELIASQPSEQQPAFTRYWTAKEAVLKALGTGITQSLSFFVGQCRPPDSSWVDVPLRGAASAARCWLQPLAPADDYIAALACLGVQRCPRCFRLSF